MADTKKTKEKKAPAKKKKPSFKVPNQGFMKSVKESWRKPRGTHNKKRMKCAWMGASPKIGYRNPSSVRGLHPSGSREVFVCTESDLDAIKGESGVLLRLSSKLGAKKRKVIAEKAKAMKLEIINLGLETKSSGDK